MNLKMVAWAWFCLHVGSIPRFLLFESPQLDFSKPINNLQFLEISLGIKNRSPQCSDAELERWWSRTHGNVGACKSSPAEEINEPVEAGQPAAALLLSFSVRGRLVPVQIVDWSHCPEACHETWHHWCPVKCFVFNLISYTDEASHSTRVCSSWIKKNTVPRSPKRKSTFLQYDHIKALQDPVFTILFWPSCDLPINTIKTGCNRLCQPH